VLSMKPPKKAAHKPPKYATAAVPFKTVADAHAAVCASGRADRGLEDFEIGWVGGCEPAVWSWSERMLRLKEERREAASESKLGPKDAGAPAVTPAGVSVDARGGLPQTSDGQLNSPGSGSQFSSFPSSFVRIFIPPPVLWNLLTFVIACRRARADWYSFTPFVCTATLRSWS
jgi:DnaJ family protein C protein 17